MMKNIGVFFFAFLLLLPSPFLSGESRISIIAIKASIHLPFDHTAIFHNVSVAVSTQATFHYKFAFSKYLPPAYYDLVGSIIYNGTIKVIEAGGFHSSETPFLDTLGPALFVLLGVWFLDFARAFFNKGGNFKFSVSLETVELKKKKKTKKILKQA